MNRLLDQLGVSNGCIPLPSSSIEITTEQGPQGFHERLHTLIRGATRRISLASLYLGTGPLEEQLLDDIRIALTQSPELTVQVLLDYARGRRPTPNGNSVTLMSALLAEHPGRVRLYLHKMPCLDGPADWLPSPLNECLGVFHFKAVVADDVSVLTGANLSSEYFECRQARYVTIRDARFAEFAHELVTTTARHSLRVDASKGAAGLSRWRFRSTQAAAPLSRLIHNAGVAARTSDTYIVPLLQHPPLGLQQERNLLLRLFACVDGDLVINTPYVNFPSDYVRALCDRIHGGRTGETTLIVPSARSHSFTTGGGVKGLVPGLYTYLERGLARRLQGTMSGGTDPRLVFRHYDRPGWVFHSKGAWLSNGHSLATVIGSSGFGRRSVSRDFDLSYLIVTSNTRLRQAFNREWQAMLSYCNEGVDALQPSFWAAPLIVPLVSGYL